MATIRRHPIPSDSFRADAPLNDLLLKQLEHFVHVAERLPAAMRADMPIPSPQDSAAVARYIAAMTARLMSRKRPPLTVVSKTRRRRTGISIAASAEKPDIPSAKRKRKSTSKPDKSKPDKSKPQTSKARKSKPQTSKAHKSKPRKHPKKSSGA